MGATLRRAHVRSRSGFSVEYTAGEHWSNPLGIVISRPVPSPVPSLSRLLRASDSNFLLGAVQLSAPVDLLWTAPPVRIGRNIGSPRLGCLPPVPDSRHVRTGLPGLGVEALWVVDLGLGEGPGAGH